MRDTSRKQITYDLISFKCCFREMRLCSSETEIIRLVEFCRCQPASSRTVSGTGTSSCGQSPKVVPRELDCLHKRPERAGCAAAGFPPAGAVARRPSN